MFDTFKRKLKETIQAFSKKIEEPKEPEKAEPKIEKEERTFLEKIKEKVTTTALSEEKFNELFYDLELVLLENNVAFEIVEKIKVALKKELVETKLKRNEINKIIKDNLKKTILSLFQEPFDVVEEAKKKKTLCYLVLWDKWFWKNNNNSKTSVSF